MVKSIARARWPPLRGDSRDFNRFFECAAPTERPAGTVCASWSAASRQIVARVLRTVHRSLHRCVPYLSPSALRRVDHHGSRRRAAALRDRGACAPTRRIALHRSGSPALRPAAPCSRGFSARLRLRRKATTGALCGAHFVLDAACARSAFSDDWPTGCVFADVKGSPPAGAWRLHTHQLGWSGCSAFDAFVGRSLVLVRYVQCSLDPPRRS
jgi:hypothetical protein